MKKQIYFIALFLVMISAQEQLKAQTASAVLSDLNGKIGQCIDYDSVYGSQCVDLIKYICGAYFNHSISGNANQLDELNRWPSGTQKITYYAGFIPEPGDVFVFEGTWGSGYGHTGVIESATSSTLNTLETNGGSGTACTNGGSALKRYSRASSNLVCVMRLPYVNCPGTTINIIGSISAVAYPTSSGANTLVTGQEKNISFTLKNISTCTVTRSFKLFLNSAVVWEKQITFAAGESKTFNRNTDNSLAIAVSSSPGTYTLALKGGPGALENITTSSDNIACGTSGCNPISVSVINSTTSSSPCDNIINISGYGSSYSKTVTLSGSGVWNSNPCWDPSVGKEQIYSFTPTSTGIYNLVVTSASGYVDYLWKSGSCSSSGWTCIGDVNSAGTYTIGTLSAGTTYYFLLDNENTSSRTHSFYIGKETASAAPANDQCSGYTTLACGATLNNQTTVGATAKTIAGNTASPYGVWYSFLGDGQETTVYSSANYDHELVLFSGSCSNLTYITYNDDNSAYDSPNGNGSALTFTTTSGTRYFVYVAYYSPNGSATQTGTFSISRTCKASTYTVTASAGTGGSVSPSGSITVSAGGSQTFTATPNSGKRVYQWKVGSSVVQTNGNTYTLSNVTANTTLSVSFEDIPVTTYSLIAGAANSGGSVSPNSLMTVNAGSSYSFVAIPNTCYEVDYWTRNGSTVQTGGTNYTCSNITANTVIAVYFKAITYTVTPSAGSGGTVSPSTAQTVNCGGSKTFTATPSSGKEVDVWKKNGSVVQTGGTTYSVSNVQANTTVQVTFKDVAVPCDDVEPLLTTKWNQCLPYNTQCPTVAGASSIYAPYAPAGCVAIATAQIMKFWEHPVRRTQPLSTITGTTTYDWNNMLDSYPVAYSGTTAQNAVAKLIMEVGKAVNMKYTAQGSSSNIDAVLSALPSFFNYSNKMTIIKRQSFNSTNNANWESRIKEELLAGRPVYYRGSGSGGHAFVCDGYKCSDNTFHFNWGWGEYCDGYFVTSVLNPDDHDYSSSQKIIINIEPNDNDFSYPTESNGTTTFAITGNTANSTGNIIPSGSTYVYLGANQPYTFEANSGYEIDQVFVDGVPDATAKENGYYIFENVAANHSIIVTFKAATGIEEVSATKLLVYPNPVKDVLHINLLGFENLTGLNAQIYDISGKLITNHLPLNTINVSHLSAGVYFVKIGDKTAKFVKE